MNTEEKVELLLVELLRSGAISQDAFESLSELRTQALARAFKISAPVFSEAPTEELPSVFPSLESSPSPPPTGSKLWNCPECGNVYPSKASLARHERIHRAPDRECPKCGKKVRGSRGLKQHDLMLHQGVGKQNAEKKRARGPPVRDEPPKPTVKPPSETDFTTRRLQNGNFYCDACGMEVKGHMVDAHLLGRLHKQQEIAWKDAGRPRAEGIAVA